MEAKVIKSKGWGERLRKMKLGEKLEAASSFDRAQALRAADVLTSAGVLKFPVRTFLNSSKTYTVEMYDPRKP